MELMEGLESVLTISYDDIVANAKVTYVAGGAAQNAARAAAVSPSTNKLKLCPPSPMIWPR
jgi:hypothetical protein